MLIRDENFRELYGSYIIVKNRDNAQDVARSFQIDSIMDEDLDNDEFQKKFKSIKIPKDINSLLVVPYIDYERGLSFLTLSYAYYDGDSVNIYKRNDDFSIFSITRRDAFENSQFLRIDEIKNVYTEDGFNLNCFEDYVKRHMEHYVQNDDITELRNLKSLDKFRNDEYPDDILVIFFKNGCTPEGMWVRYEKKENEYIIGKLLNSPDQNLGVDMGDSVKFIIGEEMCICDLNKKRRFF